MALKTSILVFYLRLSKNTQQVLRIASWIVLAIVNVAGAVLTFMNIFQCGPVKAAFSLYEGRTRCIPLLTEFVCSAPINIVTDLAILALPIPVLTGMRLPKRQKYILVFTFSLGIFVTIVDVVRIYYLQQAISTVSTAPSSDPSAIFGDSPEFAWNASLSLMWSAVEVNVGMICACIPTLKPLIVKILPAFIIDPYGVSNSELSTYGSNSREKDLTQATQNGGGPARSSESTNEPMAAPPRACLPNPSADQDQMSMMEFLTTPDMAEDREATTTAQDASNEPGTRTTWMSHRSKQDNAVYFGFVNLKRPKSMLKTSPSESLRYCIVVTTLFLLWGFSYGLLNTLNNVIATIANMTTAETIGLTTVYFGGGYFFGPLVVGEWVLRHDEHARFHRRRHKHRDPVGGFKATFIMGLCIYGTGTMMFWPSAVLTSLPGFLISNFVVGFGLAVLETAANPFIILCGPQEYAETRILVAQGFQGVATVLSGVLAQKVFFVDLNDSASTPTSLELIDVQWTYLAITLFCVALALFFYYMPLPEVRDAELGRAAQRLPVDPKKRSVGGLQLRTVSIILAVVAQWTYVAAQESMSIFFKDLMVVFLSASEDTINDDWPRGLAMSKTNYLLIAHATFAVSRFNAAHMTWLAVKCPRNRFLPSPRTMLAAFTFLTVLFALLCVVLRPAAGGNANLIAVPAVLFFFSEGPLWPLIFATGLRGQGDRTKRAAAWLTMGASGPLFWPFVMYGIVDGRRGSGSSVQLAYVVVVVLQVVALAYPVLMTLIPDARDLVDPVPRGRGRGGGRRRGNNSSNSNSNNMFELDYTESGRTTRDASIDLNEILRERQLGRRRGSAATTGSSRHGGGGGKLLNMVTMGYLVGRKKRDRRKNSSSTATSSQSPQWEHWDQWNMMSGGQQQLQEEENNNVNNNNTNNYNQSNRNGAGNGAGNGNGMTTAMGTRTPPTIPEEQ